MGDPIDQAVKATDPQRERRVRMEHKLPSGRDLIIDVPADLTLEEFRAINGWVAADMPRAMVGAPQSSSAPVVDRVAQLRALKANEN